jgi:DNA-binding transcriptional ArsR family regulator
MGFRPCAPAVESLIYNHMVVDVVPRAHADLVFHALADATRRDIVEVALGSELSVSALARRYPISLTAIQKHVAVLERAGVVHKRRQGREQLVSTDIQAIRDAGLLIERLEAIWRDRLERFSDVLAQQPQGGSQ